MSLEQVLADGIATTATRKHIDLMIHDITCAGLDCKEIALFEGDVTFQGEVTYEGDVTVEGKLDVKGLTTLEAGVVLPNSGASATTFNFLYTANSVSTWTGPWSTPPTATLNLTRIQNVVVCRVVARSPTAVDDKTQPAVLSAAIPAVFRPSADVRLVFPATVNNALVSTGNCIIGSNGIITIAAQLDGTWGGNNTELGGWATTTLCWSLA